MSEVRRVIGKLIPEKWEREELIVVVMALAGLVFAAYLYGKSEGKDFHFAELQNLKSANERQDRNFQNEKERIVSNALSEGRAKTVELRKLRNELLEQKSKNVLLKSDVASFQSAANLPDDALATANTRASKLQEQVSELNAELSKKIGEVKMSKEALARSKAQLDDLKMTAARRSTEIFELQEQLRSLRNSRTGQTPSAATDCVPEGEVVVVNLGDYFTECNSGQVISLRYVNSRHGIMNVKLFVGDKESRLKLGETTKISNRCKVRFLTFSKLRTLQSPAKFKVECA